MANQITPGSEVLDEIAAFIRRYLVCGDHQLTILTLWTASTSNANAPAEATVSAIGAG